MTIINYTQQKQEQYTNFNIIVPTIILVKNYKNLTLNKLIKYNNLEKLACNFNNLLITPLNLNLKSLQEYLFRTELI